MGEKLPLVVYKDGKRIVVGEAELEGDHILAEVIDLEIIQALRPDMSHFSIDEDVKPTRRNVFEHNEEKD